MKPVVALVFTLLLGSAPFQCRTNEPPQTEDSPAEAMWNLADHFHEQNMEDARRETLRQIVDHYPSSRQAEQARLVLDGRELSTTTAETSGDPATSPDASTAPN